jgi:SAM-dependent methyltransferase
MASGGRRWGWGPSAKERMTTIPGGTDRLERDREEAHRRYHEVFAALDRVVGESVDGASATERLATFQSLLIQFLQQITPYIDSKLRMVEQRAADAAMTATLAQRSAIAAERAVESLRAGPKTEHVTPVRQTQAGSAGPRFEARAGLQTGPAYLGFEDSFRGSEEEIRARQADYVSLFAGGGDVLDVGCGRGEFLGLLRDAGVRARGVDVNPEMVDTCRSRGLTADTEDLVEHLEGLPNDSLGGLFAAQVVEHLPPDRLLTFLRAAGRVLRPGGRLVIETINPTCWVAFFDSFIRDLTHTRPLHPETLKFLVIATGFTDVEVRFRTPIPEQDRLRQVAKVPTPPLEAPEGARLLAELVAAFNINMERLNDRLFTHLDYAVVATRT